jgi:chemotaxis protein MotC
MTCRRLCWVGVVFAVVGSTLCRAEAERQTPVDLVQELLNGQDRIAQGDRSALEAQNSIAERVAAGFEALALDTWLSPRNARALITYTLSGGDPRFLSRAAPQVLKSGLSASLIDGAVAYAMGEREAAKKLLGSVELRTLPPLLVAPVALAQAATVGEERSGAILAILDEARLLAPGTLAEEAALRRSVGILTRSGVVTEAIAMLSKYLWRFGGSVHADSVVSHAVSAIARLPRIAEQIVGVTSSLKGIEQDLRNEIWLAIAQEGLGQGARDLVKRATTEVLATSDLSPLQRARAQLYTVAAEVVSGQTSMVGALEQVSRENLEPADRELLSRVRAIDGQLAPNRPDATKSHKVDLPRSRPTGSVELKSEHRNPTLDKRLGAAIENADETLRKEKR